MNVWEKVYDSSNAASQLTGRYAACESMVEDVVRMRRALASHEERLTALLLQLRHCVEQYNELHTEQVDADQLVATIIDSMSEREQEGVTPDGLSEQAQP